MPIVKPVSLLTGGGGDVSTASWRSNSTQGNDDEALRLPRSAVGDYCADANTLELWWRPHDDVSATYTACALANIWRSLSSGNYFAFFLRYLYNGGSRVIQCYWDSGSGQSAANWSYSATPGTSVHLALKWDSTTGDVATARLYLDTVNQGPGSVVLNDGSAIADADAALDVFVGAHANVQPNTVNLNYGFDHDIGHVRYWTDLRSDAEIAANWKTNNPAGDNLFANYTLENTLVDATGNNSDATNNGTGADFSGAGWW